MERRSLPILMLGWPSLADIARGVLDYFAEGAVAVAPVCSVDMKRPSYTSRSLAEALRRN